MHEEEWYWVRRGGRRIARETKEKEWEEKEEPGRGMLTGKYVGPVCAH